MKKRVLSVLVVLMAVAMPLFPGEAKADPLGNLGLQGQDLQFYFGAQIPLTIWADMKDETYVGLGLMGNAEWRPLPPIGVTFDLGYMGTFEKNNCVIHEVPMLFGARYYLPIANTLAWYAGLRFGMGYYEYSFDLGPFGSVGIDKTGFALDFGTGVQYGVWQSLLLDFGFSVFTPDVGHYGDTVQTIFTFGARYGLNLY